MSTFFVSFSKLVVLGLAIVVMALVYLVFSHMGTREKYYRVTLYSGNVNHVWNQVTDVQATVGGVIFKANQHEVQLFGNLSVEEE
jgi:hypothetical protein